MQNLFNFVREANSFALVPRSSYVDFKIENQLVGYIPASKADVFVEQFPQVFARESCNVVTLSAGLCTEVERTSAVENVLLQLKSQNNPEFKCLKGWRNEKYSVWSSDLVLLRLERSACGLLGVRQYGCHLNGYTVVDGKLKMWIAKRSMSKPTYPGMLDNIVGGGLPHDQDPWSNIIKEAAEEAGIPESMARSAKAVSVITYALDSADRGYLFDTEFNYDLELPPNYSPEPADGEVETFYLMEWPEISDRLRKREFTKEAGLVIIDFFIRHGYITPTNEPHYLDIIHGLHTVIPFPSPKFNC